MGTGYQVIQREDPVTWREEIIEARRAICRHLNAINSEGTMLCPCSSIARARPLPAAADSTSGLLVTAQLVMGCVRFWACHQPLFLHPQEVITIPSPQGCPVS